MQKTRAQELEERYQNLDEKYNQTLRSYAQDLVLRFFRCKPGDADVQYCYGLPSSYQEKEISRHVDDMFNKAIRDYAIAHDLGRGKPKSIWTRILNFFGIGVKERIPECISNPGREVKEFFVWQCKNKEPAVVIEELIQEAKQDQWAGLNEHIISTKLKSLPPKFLNPERKVKKFIVQQNSPEDIKREMDSLRFGYFNEDYVDPVCGKASRYQPWLLVTKKHDGGSYSGHVRSEWLSDLLDIKFKHKYSDHDHNQGYFETSRDVCIDLRYKSRFKHHKYDQVALEVDVSNLFRDLR